ncbi:PREDICTED: prostaglandin D2 receptor [Chrysochloris asiatica]|uniref:Prostaglandin D2 receptor n=1 Tax=Chrysochloris asiatica TaxID=185453 RepID=A0A9B0WYZ5_CHRAS|nr:PREDICTED: prostaglandin D2 receptor [Chrysochloris asiatica]
MNPPLYRCHNITSVENGNSATMGGVLFSAGLVGNLLALVLLARSGLGFRLPRPTRSVFCVLVCGLTVMDLVGKCLVSPVVLAAYAQNRSLRGLVPSSGNSLCQAFAFFMSFFGLASMLQLLAMALECWLSLGHPFFYRRHITLRRGALVAPLVGVFCLAFCALPFAGFGEFVQYCPGTWCFIQMVHEERSLSVLGYSVLYSSLMALLVLVTVLCNLSAMRNLYIMHQRLRLHRLQRSSSTGDRTELSTRKTMASLQPLEELDHLLLLALTTVLFTMCSLPLIVSILPGVTGRTPGSGWDLRKVFQYCSSTTPQPLPASTPFQSPESHAAGAPCPAPPRFPSPPARPNGLTAPPWGMTLRASGSVWALPLRTTMTSQLGTPRGGAGAAQIAAPLSRTLGSGGRGSAQEPRAPSG